MSNSKFLCRGCREYFPRADLYRRVAGRAFCSVNCMQNFKAEYRRERARKRAEGKGPAYLPITLRRQVRQRDGNRCRWCGTELNLQVHHINYRSQGGPDEDWNLITLCDEHHRLAHSDKKRYQPLLRGYIWALYVQRRSYLIPQIARLIGQEGRAH